MVHQWSDIAQKWSAIGLAFLPSVFAIWMIITSIYRSMIVTQSTRVVTLSIEESERQISQIAHLHAAIQEMESGANKQMPILQEKSPTIAVAALSKMLDSMLDQAGGYRTSIQIQEPINREPFGYVAVRLRANLDIVSLRNFLYDVETQSLFLTVRHITLRPIAESKIVGLMQADIIVSCYFRIVELESGGQGKI